MSAAPIKLRIELPPHLLDAFRADCETVGVMAALDAWLAMEGPFDNAEAAEARAYLADARLVVVHESVIAPEGGDRE